MTFGEMIDGIGKNLGVELMDEDGAAAVQVDGNTVASERSTAKDSSTPPSMLGGFMQV